jgi:hypothetical protein
MSYVTLAEAREHLGMIHTDDDNLIQDCLNAAEDHAANYMNRRGISDGQAWTDTLEEETSDPSSDGQLVPHAVRRAILMLMAGFYEVRTPGIVGVSYTKLSAAEDMLHFYRIGLGV